MWNVCVCILVECVGHTGVLEYWHGLYNVPNVLSRSVVVGTLYCEILIDTMSELTNFIHGQIVVDCLVGASISRVAEVFSAKRGAVSKVYSACLKSRKTSTAKSIHWLKDALSYRGRWLLARIVTKIKDCSYKSHC